MRILAWALLVMLAANAAVAATPKAQADKIKAFEAAVAKRKKTTGRFDFENYSFVTLDKAVRKKFPQGTKMSYVDKILKTQGKAQKSKPVQLGRRADRVVHYTYPFTFDRWVCERNVRVRFDPEKNRVLSVRGNGRCD